MARFACSIVVLFGLVGCSTESPGQLTDGRSSGGFRYNAALPEPPRAREGGDQSIDVKPKAGTAPAAGSSADIADQCVTAINDYRAKVGAAPLTRWTDAEGCTADQCMRDAASKTPHGAFGDCTELGQNECPGWLGWNGAPKDVIRNCLADMWAEGPGGGHYENMRAARFKRVACSVHVAANGQVTAIQNFR